ncbi:HNH endonuclease [Nanoarchaeota archaeon]
MVQKLSKTIRNSILKRDDFACQKCKVKDKSGKSFEIHHIKPVVFGGTDSEDNLITLCSVCHKFAPNKESEFKEYMESECDGQLTTMVRAFGKLKNYEDLINQIFSQGDSRYFDNYNEDTLMSFLIERGITIETKDVSLIKSKVVRNFDGIPGPQKDWKLLTKKLFQEFDIDLVGFERRIAHGIVDVLGKKNGKIIYVECGPCRIDKSFNYLRKVDSELWIVTSELDKHSVNMEKATLYIIKRGPNWSELIQKHDKINKEEIKKVKSPLDNL